MWKRVLQLTVLIAVGAITYLNISYWQDPAYWRRWWDLMTNLSPEHMNFSPVTAVQSDRVHFLPEADAASPTISLEALDAATISAQTRGDTDGPNIVITSDEITIHARGDSREWIEVSACLATPL